MSGDENVFGNGLALMKAGLTRRQVLHLIGLSAVTITGASLLSACADDAETDDAIAGTADDDDGDDIEEVDEPVEDDDSVEVDDADDDGAPDDERPSLVVGVEGIPPGLDAQEELSNPGMRISYMLYDPMIRRDWQGGETPGMGSELLPNLVESWEFVDDLTLELHVREGVQFHNGDVLTADDVKFSFDRAIVDTPAELQRAADFLATIEQVDMVDEYTVHIVTAAPEPTLLMRLTGWVCYAFPKDYIEEVGVDEFRLSPVTTGPYKVTHFRADETIEFEAFDDYWAGPPPASTVTVNVIPEESGRIAALASGDADIVTNIGPDQLQTIEDADGVHVRSVPRANFNLLRYNTHNPTISDVRVRHAMNLAIDRELLVETLWGGHATVPPGHQMLDYGELLNEEREVEFDPERARELLDEAGYDGSTITIWFIPGYYVLGDQSLEAIAEMWEAVGIDVQLEGREDAFDMSEEAMVQIWSNSAPFPDPAAALWRLWGPDSVMQRDFWDAPDRYNELGEQAVGTLDQDFRYEAYQEMLDIWEEEAPGTVLFLPEKFYGVRDGVNWLPYSLHYVDFGPDNLSFD